MILGKRERPSQKEAEEVLTFTFELIKKRYQDSLAQLREETKADPISVFHDWCG
jgi:hypothetical protein